MRAAIRIEQRAFGAPRSPERRMRRRAFLISLSMAVCGCAAHEQAGDQAVAAGQWKTAVSEYGEAVKDAPGDQKAKTKYDNAKESAAGESLSRARACLASKDYECALGEAKDALGMEEGNAEIATFIADASKAFALSKVEAAQRAGADGRFREGLSLTGEAAALSSDPQVGEACAKARSELVAKAIARADELRAARAYKEALELLAVVVEVDRSRQGLLDAATKEQEQFLESEYERLAAEGDIALAAHQWEAASARYEAALQVKPGGWAQSRRAYANAVLAGEKARSRQDWSTATREYREAIASGEDASGFARQQLEQVEIKPYRVLIRSVVVKPFRPDGTPWIGPPNNTGLRVAAALVDVAVGGAPVASLLADRYDEITKSMPVENAPSLRLQVSLPDGRRFQTAARKGIYATYDAGFVLVGNHFDNRKMNVSVVHEPSAGNRVEVGNVDVTLAEILARKEIAGAGSLVSLDLKAEPAPDAVEGMVSSMELVKGASDEAQAWSEAGKGRIGVRLERVAVTISPKDQWHEMFDATPDPFVEIEQGGRVVYRSPSAKDAWAQTWLPEATYLFVQPEEQIVVRCWDRDLLKNDLLFAWTVRGRDFGGRQVVINTPNGSRVEMGSEAR
jgi:tetratricopeptide (TPR) repeat protein